MPGGKVRASDTRSDWLLLSSPGSLAGRSVCWSWRVKLIECSVYVRIEDRNVGSRECVLVSSDPTCDHVNIDMCDHVIRPCNIKICRKVSAGPSVQYLL